MFKLDAGGVLTVAALAVGGLWFLKQQKLFDVTSAENPIVEEAEAVYSAVTGSEDTPGEDLYDVLHEDAANPWGWYNPLYYLTATLDTVAGVE